ncbi:hypothetical protein [Streptomyces sp. NPDC049879]|uniref:hypothetical protein n=1 Tax=Streptomyces sp. NPDC049879 TaxID=3365598 RepID=UPI0037A0FCC1
MIDHISPRAERLVGAAVEQIREQLALGSVSPSPDRLAAHLDAARNLLTAQPWVPDRPLKIFEALTDTMNAATGAASDTRYAARVVLDAVLRLRTGADDADYDAWEMTPGRTLDDASVLLAEAADVALRYRPFRPADDQGGRP